MSQDHFDPPLFIKKTNSQDIDLEATPYFCNIEGEPQYLASLPSGIEEVQEAQATAPTGKAQIGTPYTVHAKRPEKPEPEFGEQTQLIIEAHTVHYQALAATREHAAAFGLTLIENKQGIRLRRSTAATLAAEAEAEFAHADFEYGMFAGHRSPYLGTGSRLLGLVCTDLEYHDFPHVFASVDPHLPLVISVARYWPNLHTIHFADLWLPSGSALYSPPRCPSMQDAFLDLHGNRNSAVACWPGIERTSISTKTLLRVKGGYIHWFWNDLPSIHPLLTPSHHV